MTTKKIGSDPAAVTWVHLSDIHIGHGDVPYKIDQDLVLESLADDLADLVASGDVPRPDYFVVTGDIANTGAGRDPLEYDGARTWLVTTAERVGLTPDRILTVPGNHDADRGDDQKNSTLKRLLQAVRTYGEPVDVALADDGERGLLAGRFNEYGKFVASLGGPQVGQHDLHMWSHDVVLGNGFAVRFVGLNTAVLAAGDDDEKKLQLGTTQIKAVKGTTNPAIVTVAMAHHPLGWLQDAEEAEAWLQTFSQILLSGHEHDASGRHIVKTDGTELVRLEAGAIHGDEQGDHQHQYSITRVEVSDDGHVTITYWPRVWTPAKKWRTDQDLVPDGERCAALPLKRQLRAPVAPLAASSRLADVSGGQLEEQGSRRTAYPTDLSIRDLHESDLLLDPVLVHNGDRLQLDAVVSAVVDGRSVFLRGQPGAGKSVTTFLLHDALLRTGEVVPLTVHLARVDASDLTTAAIALAAGADESDLDARTDLVLVVDGIDEALASGTEPDDVARVLRELGNHGRLVVTCRTAEFERDLLGRIDMSEFDIVAELASWTFEEFKDFARRLGDAGFLTAVDHVIDTVASSEQLLRMIDRPLLARMLTYVVEQDDVELNDATELYGSYLRKLARTVGERLRRTGCDVKPAVFEVWQKLAWALFVDRRLVGDVVDGDVPTKLIAGLGIEPRCAQVIASGLLDHFEHRGEIQARFRHYTFYEYLVASHVHAELEDGANRDGDCVDLFRHDLPQEIRRHLTRLLLGSQGKVDTLLIDQFSRLGEIDAERERRTIGNLTAYYLGRLDIDIARLRELAEQEADPFLQTSLRWALANRGDTEQTSAYLRILAADPEMAALNRGYLLYYYGDLERDAGPPFVDDGPDRSWERTRRKLVELLSEGDYREREPVERRAVDVATFADLFTFHGTLATEDEIRLLHAAADDVAEDAAEGSPLADIVTSFIERVPEQ